jgi:hypothetical protein
MLSPASKPNGEVLNRIAGSGGLSTERLWMLTTTPACTPEASQAEGGRSADRQGGSVVHGGALRQDGVPATVGTPPVGAPTVDQPQPPPHPLE